MRAVKKFLKSDRNYFTNHREEINRQNYSILRAACVIYAAVLVLFSILAFATKQAKLLCVLYLIYDAIHIVLSGFVFSRKVRKVRGGKYLPILRTFLK